VLWDLDDPNPGHDAIPCGLVIDRGDHVQVRLPDDGWGIKARFDEPFENELRPDGTVEAISPGDPRYFDCVLYSLQRTFAITKPANAAAPCSS
jgi:hypothetical protein